jgi:hypothetical protein
VQRVLATVASAAGEGRFLYTKFFAVGLFRLLELAGAKDPGTLGALVTALGVPQERVTADLLTYKGVLSKLAGAKEIMKVHDVLLLFFAFLHFCIFCLCACRVAQCDLKVPSLMEVHVRVSCIKLFIHVL